jgi:hypothetical protein
MTHWHQLRVSFWRDENVLKLIGDGCTILQMYNFNCGIAWYLSYISVKLLKKQKQVWKHGSSGRASA